MGKSNKFKKGDMVNAKKVNGEHFLGIYEYEYDCGDHCVFDGNKKFCVNHNAVKKASTEEEEIIKENIIKPMREEKKKKLTEQQELEDFATEPTEEE